MSEFREINAMRPAVADSRHRLAAAGAAEHLRRSVQVRLRDLLPSRSPLLALATGQIARLDREMGI